MGFRGNILTFKVDFPRSINSFSRYQGSVYLHKNKLLLFCKPITFNRKASDTQLENTFYPCRFDEDILYNSLSNWHIKNRTVQDATIKKPF